MGLIMMMLWSYCVCYFVVFNVDFMVSGALDQIHFPVWDNKVDLNLKMFMN